MTTSKSQAANTHKSGNLVMIRAAQKSDAEAIAQLGALVFSETFGHSVESHELDAFLDQNYTVSAILQDLGTEEKQIIVTTNEQGDITGFAYLTIGSTEPCVAQVEDRVELQRIYVHPSAHGTGIGGKLSFMIHQMARDQGFKNIWLGVWEENVKAIMAYEKWGYKQVGTHDFTIGSIMLKSLA